jgi:hypothetical protein
MNIFTSIFSLENLSLDKIKDSIIPLLEKDNDAFLEFVDLVETRDTFEQEEQKHLNLIYSLGNDDLKVKIIDNLFYKFKESDIKFFKIDGFFSKLESDKTIKINEKLKSLYPGLELLLHIPDEENDNFDINDNLLLKLKEISKIYHIVDKFNDKFFQELIYKNLNSYWNSARDFLTNIEEDPNQIITVLEFIHTYVENKAIKLKLTKLQNLIYLGYKLGSLSNNKILRNESSIVKNKIEEVIKDELVVEHNILDNYEEFKNYLLNQVSHLKVNEKHDLLKMAKEFTKDQQKEIIKLLYISFESSSKGEFIKYIIESGYQELLSNKEKIDLIFSLELSIKEKVEYINNLSLCDNYVIEKIYEVFDRPEDGISLLPPLYRNNYVKYCIKRSRRVSDILNICEYAVHNNMFNIWERFKDDFINKAFRVNDTLENKISFIEYTGVLRETNMEIRFHFYEKLYALGNDINSSLHLVLNSIEYPEDCVIFLKKKYNCIEDSLKKEFIKYVKNNIKLEQEEEILSHVKLGQRQKENFIDDYLRSIYFSLKKEFEAMKYSREDEEVIRARTILDVSSSISNFVNKFEQRIYEYKYYGINYDELGDELIAFKHLLRDSLEHIGIKPVVPLEYSVANFYYRYHDAFNSLNRPTEGDPCKVITNGLKVTYNGKDEIISLAKVDVFGVDENE